MKVTPPTTSVVNVVVLSGMATVLLVAKVPVSEVQSVLVLMLAYLAGHGPSSPLKQ
jgi:hypothetical protein